MPSVFTVDGPSCPWVLKKGTKYKGCYQSEGAARRAAKRGWSVVFSRPPGVTMQGLQGAPKDHMSSAEYRLKKAYEHAAKIDTAARKSKCLTVWNEIINTWGFLRMAQAHHDELSRDWQYSARARQIESNIEGLKMRLTEAVDSVGWQCIRPDLRKR